MAQTETDGLEVLETREWVDSLDYVLSKGGPNRAGRLLQQLALHARREAGINLPFSATTPYQNTIPSRSQPPFPGSQEMERRIKSLVRWNALAMVVRANKIQEGIGGHISTFASAATLYEVAFNHFFRAQTESGDRDIVYFQGHAAPGIYSRAYLEGRISKEKLQNFRRELKPGGGLSSYPHPWLMPEFWEFPTVSMGLGPIQAIYHARFIKYLENRGLKQTDRRQGLGVSGRWRNGRARVAGLDHAGLAREARQPDLRGELQPAAARRPGARQRKNHSGTGSHFPRRGLERHQSASGAPIGTASSRTTATACWSSGWAKSATGSIRNILSRAGPTSARTCLAPIPRLLKMVEHLVRRSAGAHAPGRARSHQSPRGVPRCGRSHGRADHRSGQDDQGLRAGRSG